MFALQAAAHTPSLTSWLTAFPSRTRVVTFFFSSTSFSHQLRVVGLGAKVYSSLAGAVPVAMSYKEGTGLTDALGWGEDSKFMFWLLEEVGLFLQRATSQADIFLLRCSQGDSGFLSSFSWPSNSGGEGGMYCSVSAKWMWP